MKSSPNCKPCLKKSKYKASTGTCSDLRTNLSFVMNEVFLEIWDSLLDCSQASKDYRRNFSGRVVSIESKSKRRYEGKKGRRIMDQGNEHDREPQRQRVTWAPSLDSIDSDDDNEHDAEEAVFPQHKIVKKSEKREEIIPISIRSNNESRVPAPSQVTKSKTSSSTASVTIFPPQNSKEHLQDQKSKPQGTETDSSSATGREKKTEGDRIKDVAMSQKQRASKIVYSEKKSENVIESTEKRIEGDRIKDVAMSQKQRTSKIVHSDKKSENVIESTATSRKKLISDGAKKTQKDVTVHEVSVVKQKKMGLPKLSSKLWLI